MNKKDFNIASKLQFLNYSVKKIHFEEVETKETNFTIYPEFMREIKQIDEHYFTVTLGCKIGPSEKGPFPFKTEVIIVGEFHIESLTEENKVLVSENSLAILFPFLRSTLSMLVLNSNHNPLLLPTINIVEFFKQSEKTN